MDYDTTVLAENDTVGGDITFTQIEAEDEDLDPLGTTLAQAGAQAPYDCWKNSYARGAGTSGGHCPAGKEMHAGMCYWKCNSGMYGVATRCYKSCPNGYRDDGAYCAKYNVTWGCPHGMTNIGVSC